MLPYLWLITVLKQVGLGLLSLYEELEPVVYPNLDENTVAVDDPLPSDDSDAR